MVTFNIDVSGKNGKNCVNGANERIFNAKIVLMKK